MSDILTFGAWLKRRRKALDLTQEALAQLVGCGAPAHTLDCFTTSFSGCSARPE